MRVINEYILNIYEEHYSRSNRPLITIYEAPTGYGKSSISPYIAYKIRESGVFYGYIHVLPMRSIVRSLYMDMVKKNKYPFNVIDDLDDNVGYQASGLFLSGKNPFYSKLYNVTTIDSFVLNLLKLSIGEINTYYKHYEASRSMIFSSMIVLDEAHLYGGDPGSPEELLYTSFSSLLNSLVFTSTPMLIVSATIPKNVGKQIYSRLRTYAEAKNGKGLWIRYGDKIILNNKMINKATDREFDGMVKSTKWKTKILNTSDLRDIAAKVHERTLSGLKVLVILNKPSRAAKIYDLLLEEDIKPVLIHGRLKHGDREESEKIIDKANVLVATQVVEAGIDVSFDVIYTDAAPPTSLVQRIGRVNRRLRDDVIGEVYIINDGYQKVYDKDIVLKTIKLIKEHADKINWRLPSSYGDPNIIGYSEVIDLIYSSREPAVDYELERIFREIIMSTRLGWKETRELMYYNCLENKGLTRSSILVSLYPVDVDDLRESRSIDLNYLEREAVPVNLHWIVNNAAYLFRDKAYAMFLSFDNNGEPNIYLEEISQDIIKDKYQLIRYLCGNICGIKAKGFFMGIIIDQNLYKPRKGLLINYNV